MTNRVRLFIALFIVVLVADAPTRACTVCDSASGAEVREALIERDFTMNLMAAALPTLVFAAVVGAIFVLGRSAPPRGADHSHVRSEDPQ